MTLNIRDNIVLINPLIEVHSLLQHKFSAEGSRFADLLPFCVHHVAMDRQDAVCPTRHKHKKQIVYSDILIACIFSLRSLYTV